MSSKEQFLDAVFAAPDAPRLVNVRFCRTGNKTIDESLFASRAKHVLFRIQTGLTAATEDFPADSGKSIDTSSFVGRYQ